MGLLGWSGYHYFLDTHYPEIEIKSIAEGGYYGGEAHAIIAGSDAYKVSDISIWLDGNELLNKYRINSASFEHPFVIPTKTLPQGKHTLRVEATNGTYARHKIVKELAFFVDNEPLQGAFIRPESDLKVFQGRTLHVQFQVNKEIKIAHVNALSQTFDCFAESKNARIYECFIPVSCEENPNEYLLSLDIVDKVGNSLALASKFQVVSFPFRKQQLNVDANKVKKEKELALANEEFERAVESLSKKSPQEKLWHGTFYPPIEITGVSTEFGTIRTTQEKGRYVHKAVDVLNTPKSVVWAPQNGVVVLKDRYALSGNTVVIDHGLGILSMFFHLDDFSDIKVGDIIKRGNPIGTLGKTGYASGYHLHWEMRINNIAVDPMQWIKPTF